MKDTDKWATVTFLAGDNGDGICVDGDLVIAAKIGSIFGFSYGIRAEEEGSVTIEEGANIGEIVSGGDRDGIEAAMDVTIKTGAVVGKIIGGYYGIYSSEGNVTIEEGATVGKIIGGDYGIYVDDGDIYIDAPVTVSGGDVAFSKEPIIGLTDSEYNWWASKKLPYTPTGEGNPGPYVHDDDYKFVKIGGFGEVVPTGFPNMAGYTAATLALLIVSAGIWGYIIIRRRKIINN